jgi:hypothetical protein
MIGERDSPHQDTRADWLFLYIRRLAEWFRSLICLRRYLKGPNLEKLRQVTFKKPRTGQKKLHIFLTLPAFFFYCVYLGVLFPSKMADSGKMLEAAPHSRVVPVQTPAQSKPKQLHYPFWFGGSASCFAASVTHPLDLGTFSVIHSIMYYMLTRPQLR